jgi:hypothetical protein
MSPKMKSLFLTLVVFSSTSLFAQTVPKEVNMAPLAKMVEEELSRSRDRAEAARDQSVGGLAPADHFYRADAIRWSKVKIQELKESLENFYRERELQVYSPMRAAVQAYNIENAGLAYSKEVKQIRLGDRLKELEIEFEFASRAHLALEEKVYGIFLGGKLENAPLRQKCVSGGYHDKSELWRFTTREGDLFQYFYEPTGRYGTPKCKPLGERPKSDADSIRNLMEVSYRQFLSKNCSSQFCFETIPLLHKVILGFAVGAMESPEAFHVAGKSYGFTLKKGDCRLEGTESRNQCYLLPGYQVNKLQYIFPELSARPPTDLPFDVSERELLFKDFLSSVLFEGAKLKASLIECERMSALKERVHASSPFSDVEREKVHQTITQLRKKSAEKISDCLGKY